MVVNTRIMKILFVGIILCVAYLNASDPKFTQTVSEECFATDHWAIELKPGTSPFDIAEKHGHELVGKIESIPGMFLFRKKEHTIHGITHPHHNESMEISWCENQIAKQQMKRGDVAIRDPLFSQQWHLHSTPSHTSAHAYLEGAWSQGIRGEGIVIAIVDDGLENTHPDLSPNYNAEGSYDFNYNDANPYPDSTADGHGTSAAGCAAARDNDVCGVGTAFRAQVSGIRLISRASTDVQEASALNYKWNINDIYSNSWGPIDDGRRKEGPGRLATTALEQGILNGRNGKGSIYVWAAGNGRSSGDNCNYDGWANSRYTISIGAVDSNGGQAWYSESCAMLLASAPSSGGVSITTTDLMGYRGALGGDCTTNFGGTSAAAPVAAGIVALIIQKNNNLSWRDVQGVIITSSSKVAPHDPDWKLNGGGLYVNHKFGYGLINATAAVNAAQNWVNLPPYIHSTAHIQDDSSIPENGYYDSYANITEDMIVEHVTIKFVATHPKRGEITIQLISPSGTVSVLAEKHGDSSRDYSWTFGSVFHWGESASGTWTLRVGDAVARNAGNLVSWDINIYGH